MFTKIAIEIARTLKKNKENLGFVAISHRFNPAKRIFSTFVFRYLAAGFEMVKRAIRRGLKRSSFIACGALGPARPRRKQRIFSSKRIFGKMHFSLDKPPKVW